MSAEAPVESIEITIGGWKCVACGYQMYPYSLPGDDRVRGPSGLVCANNSCEAKSQVIRRPVFDANVICRQFTS